MSLSRGALSDRCLVERQNITAETAGQTGTFHKVSNNQLKTTRNCKQSILLLCKNVGRYQYLDKTYIGFAISRTIDFYRTMLTQSFEDSPTNRIRRPDRQWPVQADHSRHGCPSVRHVSSSPGSDHRRAMRRNRVFP
ncbi:protein of unknown function [Rhodovastum atsumiense]|nr:protein of unknown function [Rhodovastum atsumiense]